MAFVSEGGKTANTNPLIVKPENVTFYDIESNDAFSFANLSAEEVAEIQKANAEFEKTVLHPELMGRAMPCHCQQPKLMERAATRMKLLGQQPVNGQIPVELTQEDIDLNQFGVIVNTINGRYEGLMCILKRCKACSEISIWGAIEPMTAMCAHAFNDYMNRDVQRRAIQEAVDARDAAGDEGDAETSGENSPMFVLENTETGETHAADDLGEALFGGSGSSNFKTTDASDNT